MKALQSKNAVKAVAHSDASFEMGLYQRIKTLLAPYLVQSEIDAINDALSQRKRRKIEPDDFCRIGFVHVRSIVENKGQSPYDRIIAYGKKNGFEYDRFHVKLVTDRLLEMEFISLVSAHTEKGKCRVYDLPLDVKNTLLSASHT